MKSIKDSIIDFVKSEEIKQDLYSIVEPVRNSIYNEMFPYLMFICIYIAVLTFIILTNLILLVRLLNNLSNFYISTSI
jgi:vacuolar-type H+-ATPase subunit I/STV1